MYAWEQEDAPMEKTVLEFIKAYIDNAKTIIQLSSAGLALPAVLHSQVIGLFHRSERHSLVEVLFIVLSWLCFLASIAAGTWYQYSAIKFAEFETEPNTTYVPFYSKYLVEKRGPGVAYGAKLIAFYAGAVCVVVYSLIEIAK
jgi:hypothetical protein